jgi:hypothetical protein
MRVAQKPNESKMNKYIPPGEITLCGNEDEWAPVSLNKIAKTQKHSGDWKVPPSEYIAIFYLDNIKMKVKQ